MAAVPAFGSRVVLAPDAAMPFGYRIVSSFPIP
jgi:hypothetical protein